MFPEMLPGFVLKLAGSYLDAKYTSFSDGSGFDPTNGLFFGQGSLTLSTPRYFAVNDAVRTPEYSFPVGPNFHTAVQGGLVEIVVDYSYHDGYYFTNHTTTNTP